MTGLILAFIVAGLFVGGFAFLSYRRVLRRAKAIERGIKMVPVLIHLPPPSQDTVAQGRDVREVLREKISQGETLYNLLSGTAAQGFKSRFYGQRHISLELVATNGLIHFYAAVPVGMLSTVQQALVTAYPGARLEEVEDYNIFNPQSRISGTAGGELTLKAESAYPIATYQQLERDPLEALINVLSSLKKDEGAGVQFLIRPANPSWTRASLALSKKRRRNAGSAGTGVGFTPKDIALAAVKSPEARRQEIAQKAPQAMQLSDLELSTLKAIEDKTQHPGFETLVRIVTSSANYERSQQVLRDIVASFALFEAPGLNGFKLVPAVDVEGLATAYIFRFFPPELHHDTLNSVELATMFHLPDAQFTPSQQVERQLSKQVDGPPTLPAAGLLLGYNLFRGVRKEIRLSPEDRRRHTYIIGQTGTGKSTMLENLAVQDMLAGHGFAFIDPHGDTAEKLISMVPKQRAEDVIYFNPADTEHPLGLNLFEFTDPNQKDFLIQEAIGMLYKLYDPGHTGIIGPRFEQWFRNAALTLMSDPAGASFIEIPKVFTDSEYLKQKFRYLQDPTVIDFWTKEMAQTSDYHKSEMLGWFNSKFGAFAQNQIMRNIIGQVHSAFSLRDIMDQKKILIVNLSKGMIGDLNSQLLGIIFVIKFQAAAMSRAGVDPSMRPDFSLYVDEFQNFSTDSFASILSEARKYGLNLVVANQFIGQLTDQIRDAVFGNVGTLISFRVGPEDAEFLVKQFAPIFDSHDLVNVPNFNSILKLMIGGVPSQPFSLVTLPPLNLANAQLGAAVKQLSAAKFGVNRQQVESEILARMSARPAMPAATMSPPSPVPAQPAAAPLPPPPPPAAPQPLSPPPVQAQPAMVANPVTPQPAPPPPVPAAVPPAPAPTPPPVASVPSPAPVPVSVPSPAPAMAAPQPVPTQLERQSAHLPVAPASALPGGSPPQPKPAEEHKPEHRQAKKKPAPKHTGHQAKNAHHSPVQPEPRPAPAQPAAAPLPAASAVPVAIEPPSKPVEVPTPSAPVTQPTPPQPKPTVNTAAPLTTKESKAAMGQNEDIQEEIHSAGLDAMIKIVLPPASGVPDTQPPADANAVTVSADQTPPTLLPPVPAVPTPPVPAPPPVAVPPTPAPLPMPKPLPASPPPIPVPTPPAPPPVPLPPAQPTPAPQPPKPPQPAPAAPTPPIPTPAPVAPAPAPASVPLPPTAPKFQPPHIKEVAVPQPSDAVKSELVKAITSTEPTSSDTAMLRSPLVKPALQAASQPTASPADAKPNLNPGEVYIDEHGNVVTG